MKLTNRYELNRKYTQCDITTETQNFYIKVGDKYILTHNSPAVVCWHKFTDYPDDSICLKSFITSNKNCMLSYEDIEEKYGDRPDMALKLKYCLDLAKSIPSGEAWQGDCLYTKNNLKTTEINGVEYLTFQPNKIIYAFSENNPTYNVIKNSDFGICFHTKYRGNLQSKSQSFNVNATDLVNVPSNIYVMSPSLTLKSTQFDSSEIKNKYNQLKQDENKLLNDPLYEELVNNKIFMQYWNTFENSNLSDKKQVTLNINSFYNDLKEYINNKIDNEYNKKLSGLKTDKGIKQAQDKYNGQLIWLDTTLDNNKQTLINLVKCLNDAAELKMLLWAGYKKNDLGYNTFYKHRVNGYIPADMEGISLSDMDGNIVKVVDRSTFSSANRDPDIESGFMHEDLDEDHKSFIEEYGD